MDNRTNSLNSEVTNFLDELNHPFRMEIELLRQCILTANNKLTEKVSSSSKCNTRYITPSGSSEA
jgi:chorismate-pyruvate lyase